MSSYAVVDSSDLQCFLTVGEETETVEDMYMDDHLSSSDNPVAVSHLHVDAIPSPSAQDFSHFAADESASSFEQSLPAQGHSPSSNLIVMGRAGGGRRGGIGGSGGREEIGMSITGRGIITTDAARASEIANIESEGRKNDLSTSPSTTESISQALHCLQDSSMMMSGGSGLPIQLEQLQGLIPHRSGVVSRLNKPLSNSHHHHHERDGFGRGDLINSQDDSLQQDHTLALRLTGSSRNADSSVSSETALGRSLSYPNLTSTGSVGESSNTAILQPGEVTSKSVLAHSQQTPILTHSQTNPSITFPANLGSFTLSSMVGHFAPPFQHQSLQTSINSSSDGRSGNANIINISTQSRLPVSSLSSSSVSSLLGGGSNPSLSIVNPPLSFNVGGGGGGGGGTNLLPSSNLSMPLAHPIASNPPTLPLLSGMPAVYSYPYSATLPTQSISTPMMRVNPPGHTGFPPPGQTLAPGGYQYVSPSLYGNSQHPPVSTCNYNI